MLVAGAAKAGGTPVAILIDELQYLSSEDLSALIASVHKVGQRNLPLIFLGAGLPQLAALAGEAKSYAEQLFDYPEVGALERSDAEWGSHAWDAAAASPITKADVARATARAAFS